MENTNTTENKDSSNIVETINQEEIMKNIKNKEQIQKEIEQRLNSQTQNSTIAAALMASIPSKKCDNQKTLTPIEIHRFEVRLYEEDEAPDGSLIKKVVNGGKPEYIEAESPAALQEKLSLYKACGQFPSIKEVGPTRFLDPITKKEITIAQAQEYTSKNNQTENNSLQQNNTQNSVNINIQKRPVKFYKIGGIDIKDDNGKIYQKQWMKLSEDESKNVRVINDKTNAIFNLNGKHIEMMKWILVENNNEEQNEDNNNE